MVADMAQHPSFAPEEIERQRQQMVSALQVNMADPAYIATTVFDRLVYGFNPYGMPDNGTPETAASITRNDLEAYHAKYFVPNNAVLAVVGDVTAEEAFSTVERVFGSWPMKALQKDKVAEPPNPARRVIVINRPDAVQTEIRVGHLGIEGVSGVRVGRRVELTVDAEDPAAARALVDRLASELLSNPLIEAYAVEDLDGVRA